MFKMILTAFIVAAGLSVNSAHALVSHSSFGVPGTWPEKGLSVNQIRSGRDTSVTQKRFSPLKLNKEKPISLALTKQGTEAKDR